MEKDILSEVIEVEREIQYCLEQERIKVRDWLENVKKESSDELARSEREIRDAYDRSLDEIEQEAAVKAAEITREAERLAERFRTLDEDTLRGIAKKQIAKILPG